MDKAVKYGIGVQCELCGAVIYWETAEGYAVAKYLLDNAKRVVDEHDCQKSEDE